MGSTSLFSSPPGVTDIMRRVRRHQLARTGLAWLIMMQVMMLAFPGYLRNGPRGTGAQHLLDQAITLMNWASLILCVPLVTYCAWPLWQGAYRDFARRRVGMNVPVALGILAAFIPSAVATWRDTGEVYFDSASMFVAFLLLARLLENSARQSAGGQTWRTATGAALLRQADRLAYVFVCLQVVLAIVVGLYWWQADPTRAVAVTVALLVMSCPCALSLSVPVALAAAHVVQARHPGVSLDRQVRRVARWNLFGSLAWHVLMAPIAALGWIQPWVAALTMLLSSLAVVAHAWVFARRAPRDTGTPGFAARLVPRR